MVPAGDIKERGRYYLLLEIESNFLKAEQLFNQEEVFSIYTSHQSKPKYLNRVQT